MSIPSILLNMDLSTDENNVIDLKRICLNCIIINFDKLMDARKTESIASNYFEFLQRKFSKDLLLQVSKSCFIRHLDFLLNRHLKEVHIDTLNYTAVEMEKIIERLKEIGDEITSLKLLGHGCEETQLVELTSGFLPNVKSLVFFGTNLSQEVLLNIRSHCKFLEELDVSSCDITDKCLESFCSSNEDNNNTNFVNNALRHLNISETQITTLGIASALKNLPNLSVLSHDSLFEAIYNLHFEDMKSNPSVVNTYHLEELYITDADHFPDAALEICVSVCPHVKKLTIGRVMSQPQVNAISKFSELKELYLQASNQSLDFSMLFEQRGCYLETLDLTGCKISSELLLKSCSKLRHLSYTYSSFLPLDEENPCTYTLRSLKKITLNGLEFSLEENAKSANLILASSPNLEELHLRHTCGLTDELLKLLTKLPFIEKLTYLDVGFSDISADAAKSIILAFPNLKALSVTDCNFTKEEFAEMQSLRPLLAMSWLSNFSEEIDSEVDVDEELFEYDYFDFSDNPNDYYYDFSDYDDYGDYGDYD